MQIEEFIYLLGGREIIVFWRFQGAKKFWLQKKKVGEREQEIDTPVLLKLQSFMLFVIVGGFVLHLTSLKKKKKKKGVYGNLINYHV